MSNHSKNKLNIAHDSFIITYKKYNGEKQTIIVTGAIINIDAVLEQDIT